METILKILFKTFVLRPSQNFQTIFDFDIFFTKRNGHTFLKFNSKRNRSAY